MEGQKIEQKNGKEGKGAIFMTKQIKIIIAIPIVAILGVASFVIYKNNTAPDNLLGGDRDAHGCIGSAGYSWCEQKQKCLRIWEETCIGSAEEIQKLFAEKYPKYAKTVTVSVDQETQNYARGNVIFEAGAPGGIFLAAKIDSKWLIVFDGNGQIPCNLSKYGFPSNMLADCF